MFDAALAAHIDDVLTASDLITRVRRDSLADLRRNVLATVARSTCGRVNSHDRSHVASLIDARILLWRELGWPSLPTPRARAAA